MKRAVLSVVFSLLTVYLGLLTVFLWNGIYDRAHRCDEVQRGIERRRIAIELLEMELRSIENRRGSESDRADREFTWEEF